MRIKEMAGVDQVLKQALRKYKHADIAKTDVTNAMCHFKDLCPSYDCFTFNDGTRKDLLNLDGTIPVQYKGRVYNIPIVIWILDKYPYYPPIVFVNPNSMMRIKPGRNVDPNGKVDLPYLHNWRYPQSELLILVQILVLVFGEEPPVFSKAVPKAQPQSPYPGAGQFQTPYPMQGSTDHLTQTPVKEPLFSAQDILLCDLCQTDALQSYCELCNVNLCINCVGKHLSDSSKRHNVVPYRHKTSTPHYPKCSNHKHKNCELYCEKCKIPVCTSCLSSRKHKGHNLSDALQKLSSTQKK
ncbi:tumor susceptibility gene 101 protein-like isoform X1 [Saccostrea cucullata]|uniref:tumor susceptibility gene 101 protein-like isoform X1 n=1 Tax=Saccostrea cuccullata TaxID=36930 RepID=UPI002ED6578B